jgi:hypothetical protein
VESHLRECAGCADELSRLRALSGMVREVRNEPVPGGLLERLHERVAPPADRVILQLCRKVALAAATLLVACSVLLAGDLGRADSPAPPAAWEVAAVTVDRDAAPESDSAQLAAWIVQDLSRENLR